MYKIIATEGNAKRGELTTAHGKIQTPVFMNVATCGAIKGAVSTKDLQEINCQVLLSNTYHLHIRPGDELIKTLGGLHKFINWQGPILTDSGGFQVLSLAKMRKISEEGVAFSSHVDGRKIFMAPEDSFIIQSNLGSTIAMALDECPPYPCDRQYMQASVDRTTRWLKRCIEKKNSIEKSPLLFGINQGGTFHDIRIAHAKTISEFDSLDGYAIGGLAVGESHDEMYLAIEKTVEHLPKDKPTYLMGVGTPENILNCVERGIDFFDCVLPARNARHGHVYTSVGKLNMLNAKHITVNAPIDEACQCPTCKSFSRAYIHHLFKAKEMLAMRLCVMHNLFFYNNMMKEIRDALENNAFAKYKRDKLNSMNQQK